MAPQGIHQPWIYTRHDVICAWTFLRDFFFLFSCETPPPPSFDFHMLGLVFVCVVYGYYGIRMRWLYRHIIIGYVYNIHRREKERGLQIMRRWWARKTTRKLINTFSVFTSVRLFFSRILLFLFFVCVYKGLISFDTFGDDERWFGFLNAFVSPHSTFRRRRK